MKRLLILSVFILLLAGCGSGSVDSDASVVYASFYPIADFAAKIAGDTAGIRCLVPAGTEPHDWEPAPRDIAGLEQARLFFFATGGFEHWVPEVLPGIQNKNLKAVETGAGIDAIPDDPHFWLSPAAAKIALGNLHAAFVEQYPENRAVYDENLVKWSGELDKLDEEYRAAIAALPGREIVVAHAAFGYLCRDYGLSQVAARGFSPEQEPDPARMAEVIAHCRRNGTRIIFFESAASPRVAEAIARETGAETAVLSPLEMPDEAGSDYFAQMRANLEQLARALA